MPIGFKRKREIQLKYLERVTIVLHWIANEKRDSVSSSFQQTKSKIQPAERKTPKSRQPITNDPETANRWKYRWSSVFQILNIKWRRIFLFIHYAFETVKTLLSWVRLGIRVFKLHFQEWYHAELINKKLKNLFFLFIETRVSAARALVW